MQTFNYLFNLGGNFSIAMEGISKSTGKFNANINAAQKGIIKLTQTLAAINLATDFVKNVGEVVSGITEAGSKAELQLINMKTLFGGNAEAAQAMYERISEYGKVTPYDKAGLIEAQRTMMSFGMSGESAFDTLKQIGDIAMGDSDKMHSLALAFAQMSSTGKLTGQDLLQMVNAGFNPLNEISKQTGQSVAALKESMSKGDISVEMVSEAFRSATSEGGLFYRAIDEASQTAVGKMASIRDTIEEIKVRIFNATGNMGLWIDAVTQVAVPFSQLIPLFTGIGSCIKAIAALNFRGMLVALRWQINLARRDISGFARSLTLSGFSWTAFKTSAVTACRAVGVAIKNIPIIGWITAAIAALIAIGAYFWNTSAKFRAVLKGLWASFKTVFAGIGEMAKQVFGSIGDLIKAAFSLDGDGIEAALNKMKSGFADYGSQVGKAFSEAYDAEMAASTGKKDTGDVAYKQGISAGIIPPPVPGTDVTSGSLMRAGSGTTTSAGNMRQVSVCIDKLVERFEIHTTNIQGDISRVKDMVSEALLSALNDVNLAV